MKRSKPRQVTIVTEFCTDVPLQDAHHFPERLKGLHNGGKPRSEGVSPQYSTQNMADCKAGQPVLDGLSGPLRLLLIPLHFEDQGQKVEQECPLQARRGFRVDPRSGQSRMIRFRLPEGIRIPRDEPQPPIGYPLLTKPRAGPSRGNTRACSPQG
jgi:hypothetical protein